jgi:predicted TIM-barrel fold metal-dependent hydrolase
MKSQNEIFKNLRSNYSLDDKFVILTLNMDHMGAGPAKFSFNEQIHEIKRIKAQHKNTCLPFYSVDPRAATSHDLKEQAVTFVGRKGFVGVKIYPALGFYPFDPGLEETYQWAEKFKVPVMTHCTRVGSYYLGNITQAMTNPTSFADLDIEWPSEYEKSKFPKTEYLDNNEEFCDYFGEIYNYAVVLSRFKKLKICFAHLGGSPEILMSRTIESGKSWFTQIKYLMKEYEHVYADISYTLYDKRVFPELLDLLKDEKIGHKVLFGTDFFMTLQEDTERNLISEFREYVLKNSTEEDLWEKLTYHNAKTYLSSEYYSAP